MAGRRRETFEAQHADRGIRAHSALVGLSGVGLGNGRQRASAGVPEEVRLGDGAERSYPPSHAESRGQCYVSHCLLDSISATAAGQGGFAGTDESAGGATEERPGNHRCELRSGAARAGSRRFDAGVTSELIQVNKSIWSANRWNRRKGMRRSVSIAVLTTTLLFGAGTITGPKNVLASAQQKPETIDVKIDNFSFGPATLTVPVGTTVTWTNRDDIPHTVVSTDGVFKSKVLDTDEKFSFTFSKAGTYPYFCSIHPKMTGKVVVQ